VVFLLFLSQDTAAVSPRGAALLSLAPLGVFGLFRYMQLLAVRGVGGDPARALLRDRVIVVTAVLAAGLAAVLAGLDLLSGW